MNSKTNTSKAFTSASQWIENSRESLVSSRKFDNEKILAQSAQNELTSNYSRLTTSQDNSARSALNELATSDYLLTTKRTAFTMAEILLSLTIIGVVAAITLPSLTGNINERTWNTQRKALLSRMSQAVALMPSLNSYGVGATDAETINNAAETFITNGLSKVLKINNICSNDKLTDCGFAEKYTDGGGVKQDLPKEVKSLNPNIVNYTGATESTPALITVKNTKAAAFETANGESILTFYNPNCTASNVLISDGVGLFVKQHVCANFFYDLNGKKGPNTVGKDIGTIAVIYSSDSKVVMPMYPKGYGDTNYQGAVEACRDMGDGEYRLPNMEEVLAVYYNRLIYSDAAFGDGDYAWSSTNVDASHVWAFGNNTGRKFNRPKTATGRTFCVQR